MQKLKLISIAIAAAMLASCASTDKMLTANQAATTDITIFSINDFHGNLQADQPVPYVATKTDPARPAEKISVPAGGYAYLTTKLKERRQAVGSSIFVGAGDLIGASPMGSALMKDEPVIEALNRLDLSVTAVGNHEFDNGTADLMRKIKGECPATGCAYADFKGARFSYLGANIHELGNNKPWLTPYVIRQVGDFKVGFIGAVTADVPNLVAGDAVKHLSFEDEATAINRYVPELQKQGVAAIVVLIHEGATYKGSENDPSYRCEGLQGPIIEISKKLDKAISLVVSGHSHQGYTCKIDGKLVVQGRSYGSFLTESTLTIDSKTNQVINAVAVNHLIDQQVLQADPVAKQLVDQVATQTARLRQRPIVNLSAPLSRNSEAGFFDSSLGNIIADSQLHHGQHAGGADAAFMNAGGIRSDLPSGKATGPVAVSYGDLYAVQPFGNNLVRIKLTGAQILTLLQQQWSGREVNDPKKLFVSHTLSYSYDPRAGISERVKDVRIKGKPLDLNQQYSVVVNSFMADGGDGFAVLKQAKDKELIGRDLEAFESYVREQGSKLNEVKRDRVKRLPG
ncbi:multifunctional 2',3'-cyclic-nucleotide 2'-phosphodiesterase/5'-nucleotidase/3'-nucleotidase [Undibacterium sp. YM2]|uniref:bifunctional metallophosphatase/5'-nucleotidase n=1 Tax=Undibacterium sp. YM2 TaxID=2058625 RepID=UPI001331CC78|nr:bifunctional metallophosphatase/5'-nucleotidase [Undibacterium sp. YM2]BBB69523.1 multifunctional 2',3'-cyclic-nucleotide 2'-phosphodiesterase/5'-nucleotidase/3'-nucleotidase [Undibacterium sp. YM2]